MWSRETMQLRTHDAQRRRRFPVDERGGSREAISG
jgi:hypothetical protein